MYSMKTYIILFCGVFALSTSAIFVKIADAPSSVIAFYRLLIAGLILFTLLIFDTQYIRELKIINKKEWIKIILSGFFLALHYMLWFESLRFTSIASSIVIVCLQPLFSLGLERFTGKKDIRYSALAGCIIALCGCFIIGFGDFKINGKYLLGDIMAFIAAGVIALYFFIGESVRKNISAVTYSTLSYLISSSILLFYIILQGEALGGYSQQTWVMFIGLALISTIGGQFVFNILLKTVPSSAVTMSILGEPIGACILAYLILHEGMTLQQLIGILIIMTGMVVFFYVPPKNKT